MSGHKEQSVIKYLIAKIESGAYQMGKRIPSEYRLAEKFGIDKSTANRAVSVLVSRGYLKRTKGAGGTVLIRSNIFPVRRFAYIGVLPQLHSYYARLLRGLVDAAYAARSEFLLLPFHVNSNLAQLEEDLASMNLDLLFVGGTCPAFRPPQCPILFLDTKPFISGANIWCLNGDNRQAGKLQAEHLWNNGHRKVAYLHFSPMVEVMHERYLGAREYAESVGMELREIKPVQIGPMSDMDYFHDRLWKKLRDHVTAILFENDLWAAEFLQFCRKREIRIPEDISICGCVFNPEFQPLKRITSVDFFPQEMGEYAVSCALRILDGDTADMARDECMPISLVEGETVRRL